MEQGERMTIKRFVLLFAGAILLTASQATAKDRTIANRWFQVRYEEQTRRLLLAERASGKIFASAEPFAPEGTTVRTVKVADKTFAEGEALEVTQSDGSRDQAILSSEWPFVFFRTSLKNGDTPSVTNRVAYPSLTLDLGLPPAALNTLGTGGLLKPGKNPGSYMWTAVADPATRRGVVAGWITTDRGSGIVRMEADDQVVRLLPHVDYGRLPLASGQSETLETFAVGLFDDARLGLEAYADTLAKVLDIHLPPMPTVHCTWYVDGASRESVLTGRTDYASQVLKPYGLGVMQIDDGWQLGHSKNGPKKVFIGHNPDGPYPSGMKATANTIRAAGMTAGIWLIPFAGSSDDPWFADKTEWFAQKPDGKPYDTRWGGTCFDLTRADTQAYLKDVIRTLTQDWGYRYLKMDGLYTGASINLNYVCDTFREDEIGQAVLTDPKITQIEMMRNSLKLVRQTAGKDVFLLGCCIPQNMRSAGAAFGLVDAMRIGPDNGATWASMMRGPEFGAWQYFLNRRVWYNDPDPLYVRASLPLEHAQVICSWVTLSGQMNSSSENYAALPTDRLDLLKRTLPSHAAVARPVDLFENRIPCLWLVTDAATPALPRRDVVGLFNWDSTEKSVDEPLAKIGLAGDGEQIAFDFWSNALTPPFKGRLTQTLRPQSCAVLAVRPVLDRPQLISTSRHITQGLVDVIEERWDAKTRTLSGVSQTVAGDPYELRILTYTGAGASVGAVASATLTGWNGYELAIAPGDGVVVRPDDAYANANTPDAPMTRLFEPKTEEGLVRVTFTSGSSGTVAWKVTFSDKPAPALAPSASALKAEMPDLYGPVILTWSANTRACEIRREGKVVAPAALGSLWRDTRVASDKTFRYEVVPFTLSGARGDAQAVSFTVPVIPQLGDVPPKPEVKLDALTPVKTAVGWGSFKAGTALNGPLRLGKETFSSGVCLHADGYAVYTRDPAWKRFVAIVGIDESQRPQNQSSVIFSVAAEAADGRRVLATSPVIRFGQRDRWHFNLELPKDTERVVLLSESAGDGNKSDHANWCDAGFIK
jgi:hypothetical protein